MRSKKEKSINLILIGLAIEFVPLILVGFFSPNLNTSVFRSLVLGLLFLFLLGYKYLIKGCCLYSQSKGYSSRLGWLGLSSLLGLSILLLIPTQNYSVSLPSSEDDHLEDKFKEINIAELFLILFLALSGLFLLILLVYCSLNHLNFSNISKKLVITNALNIGFFLSFLLILLRKIQKNELSLDSIVGWKNTINFNLILTIAVVIFGFDYGFNSINLYGISFVFPGHVEEYINKKYFTTILEMILWGFHIIFLGASVEEFFFRGLISQKWALKWGVKTGILSSSLLFAIYHFRFDIIPLFLMGVMYSVLYFKTRNLFTTILCHLFHNATVVTWNATEYFSQSPVQRSAFITLKDYQNSIQPLLGQKIFR